LENTRVLRIYLASFYVFTRHIIITQLGGISILLIGKYNNKALLKIK
jgi:hypothetical protein